MRNNNFEFALDIVLSKAYNSLKQSNIEWVIAGSGSTRLQGIDINPGDIDILMRSSEGVYFFADIMSEFSVNKCDTRESLDNEKWISSKALPVLAEEPNPKEAVWHFGRWHVNDFKVEVAHIQPPADYLQTKKPNSGIWECGPEVWPHIKHIKYKSYELPVIPLEIQLQTNINRNLERRINETISLFNLNGFNEKLLEKSLSQKNMDYFKEAIK